MLWFNENRSCIEIQYTLQSIRKGKSFNENRSCIEILFFLTKAICRICLMKTEVVLKFRIQA